MAFRGSVAQLPCGLAGMARHENRLLAEPTELFDANGVTMEDLTLRKEAGAVAYDTSGITGSPVYSGTASQTCDYVLPFSYFRGSAIAFVKNGGVAHVTSTNTITVTVPAGGHASGNFVAVSVGWTGIAAFPTAVTDTAGNTWSFASVPRGSSTFTHYLVYSKLTSGLSAANTITITLSTTVTEGSAASAEYSGVDVPHIQFNTRTSASPTTSIVSYPLPTLGAPLLLIAAIGTFQSGSLTVSITPSASFNARTASGGSVQHMAHIQDRIDTTTPTIIGMADWASEFVVAAPAGTVTITAGSTTVTGASTSFTTYAPGDRIIVGNEVQIINTITSNTVLDTIDAWSQSFAPATAFKIRIGNRLITATSGGTLLKEKPLTLTTGDVDAVTLKSGLSLVARPGFFVKGGKEAAADARELFYFNGVDPIQVLADDGTTTANIATPPADWATSADPNQQPIGGVIHNFRLAAYGNLNDPHRIYFSDPDNHQNFTSLGAADIRFRSDIGDRIYSAVSFQGILFVWKWPRGIFYLDDSNLLPINWVIRVKSESLGCAPSPYSVLSIDDDVIFMAADGTFHLLSAVASLGGTRASDLSRRLGIRRWLRENLNLTRIYQTTSVWYPQTKTAIFAAPSTGSTQNDLLMRFDFSGVERDLPIKFSYSRRDAGDGLAVRRDVQGGPEQPLLGESGFVYRLDQDARNKNGAAYTGQYQTAETDFSHLDPVLRYRRKHFEHLEILMRPVAAGDLTVKVYVDDELRQTLTYDATQLRQKRKLNVGDGYYIKIEGSNGVLDEDFEVLSHLVYFTVGEENTAR